MKRIKYYKIIKKALDASELTTEMSEIILRLAESDTEEGCNLQRRLLTFAKSPFSAHRYHSYVAILDAYREEKRRLHEAD